MEAVKERLTNITAETEMKPETRALVEAMQNAPGVDYSKVSFFIDRNESTGTELIVAFVSEGE